MSRKRLATKTVNGWFGSRTVSGYVPVGVEYFHATYQSRTVEYCLEMYEIPEMVDVIFLDNNQSSGEEIARVSFSDIDHKSVKGVE